MKKVIILGGGYGGIKALETLSKEKIKCEILLIDKNVYHYMQTESYDFVVSNSSLKDITIPLFPLVKGINNNNAIFINDEAINIKNNTLICKKGSYEFDYLIIATGSITKVPKIFKNFLEVKELKNATNLKQKFEDLVLKHLKKEKNSSHIVVIGGGASGIEIAAEMQHFINELKLNNEIKITVVADIFLAELDESSKKKVIETIENMGIVIKQSFIDKVEENKIFLDDEIIKFDFGIVATGIETNDFIKNLSFKKVNGFLETDEYLRVKENVFAIGDCAILKDKKGNILPPTAQTAEQSGIIAAKNIINLIQNKPLKKADIKIYGLAIALGGKFAIAKVAFFEIDGILAYLGKKAIEKYYKIPLKLKISKF